MNLNYFYAFDFATRPNVNRRETEREYFMRLANEQEAVRTLEKRQARARKLKAALRSLLSKVQMKRTASLEALLGH